MSTKEVVLQSCMNCGVSKVAFAVQLLFVGAALLVVKVNVLAFDILELVVLCTKHMYIGYNAGIPKVVKGIVDDEATGATGIEDGVVGVFNTRAMEVGSGKGSCMKGGAIDGLVLALCPLVDYSVID